MGKHRLATKEKTAADLPAQPPFHFFRFSTLGVLLPGRILTKIG